MGPEQYNSLLSLFALFFLNIGAASDLPTQHPPSANPVAVPLSEEAAARGLHRCDICAKSLDSVPKHHLLELNESKRFHMGCAINSQLSQRRSGSVEPAPQATEYAGELYAAVLKHAMVYVKDRQYAKDVRNDRKMILLVLLFLNKRDISELVRLFVFYDVMWNIPHELAALRTYFPSEIPKRIMTKWSTIGSLMIAIKEMNHNDFFSRLLEANSIRTIRGEYLPEMVSSDDIISYTTPSLLSSKLTHLLCCNNFSYSLSSLFEGINLCAAAFSDENRVSILQTFLRFTRLNHEIKWKGDEIANIVLQLLADDNYQVLHFIAGEITTSHVTFSASVVVKLRPRLAILHTEDRALFDMLLNVIKSLDYVPLHAHAADLAVSIYMLRRLHENGETFADHYDEHLHPATRRRSSSLTHEEILRMEKDYVEYLMRIYINIFDFKNHGLNRN